MNEKLYYITDTYGTYYGMNSGNKLGAVTDIEHAQKFTLVKANNWIQKMARPMQRYQYILMRICLKQMRGLDGRIYTPRVLNELFEHVS